MLVPDRFLVHRDDGFWSRWAVAKSTVWSLRVVVFSPFFESFYDFPAEHWKHIRTTNPMMMALIMDDLRLFQGVEDFAIKQLIPEAGIDQFCLYLRTKII